MARRQFQVVDVVGVLQHWQAGRQKAVVAASLGVDVKKLRKYVAAAEAGGIAAGDGQATDRDGWAVRVTSWFPELVNAKARSRTWPALETSRDPQTHAKKIKYSGASRLSGRVPGRLALRRRGAPARAGLPGAGVARGRRAAARGRG